MAHRSKRAVTAVFDVVASVQVRAIAAALLLLLAAVLPAVAANSNSVWLSDPGASPSNGTTTTDITLTVDYHDQGGLAPAYVRVSVGNAAYSMHATTASTDWRHGVAFTITTRLPAGTFHPQFEAANSKGATGSIDGPTVSIQGPAPTPTPTPTPKPTPTPTPKPTATATPTPTAKPTATPTPTATPPPARPSGAPVPTASSSPGSTPGSTASGSPSPTDAASPTDGTSPTDGASTGVTPPSDAPSPSSSGAAVAVIVPPGGPNGTGGSGTGGQGGSGSGSGDARVGPGPSGGSVDSLFGSPRSMAALLLRLTPMMMVTTGGVAMTMAFFAFGRRRRDEAPTAPDPQLAAAAASGMPRPAGSNLVPASVLVNDAEAVASAVRAAAVGPVVAPVDADVPRWRRASLMEARKADPTRSVRTSVNLTFTGQAGEAVSGLERRRIRYRLVSLLDQPDDVRGVEISSLDEGDEVVLLERLGTYWRVLCPDGRQGWIHKMVLGAPIVDAPPPPTASPLPAPKPSSTPTPAVPAPPGRPVGGPTWTAADEGPAPGSFEDVLRLYSERRHQLGDA